jgi:hypothetical protein
MTYPLPTQRPCEGPGCFTKAHIWSNTKNQYLCLGVIANVAIALAEQAKIVKAMCPRCLGSGRAAVIGIMGTCPACSGSGHQ